MGRMSRRNDERTDQPYFSRTFLPNELDEVGCAAASTMDWPRLAMYALLIFCCFDQ